MGSFYKPMKVESVNHVDYIGRDEGRLDIVLWIEDFSATVG